MKYCKCQGCSPIFVQCSYFQYGHLPGNAALEKMTFSKQEDKALWEKVLVLEMMSSEDSEIDEEEEVLMVHPLPWRASKVDAMS